MKQRREPDKMCSDLLRVWCDYCRFRGQAVFWILFLLSVTFDFVMISALNHLGQILEACVEHACDSFQTNLLTLRIILSLISLNQMENMLKFHARCFQVW
jgi:hypothetical protein